jgi:hypothetical protein
MDNETTRLLHLQGLLGLEAWSASQQHQELESYKLSLELERREESNYQQMYRGSIHRFKDGDLYRDWDTCPESCMLLLVGVSNANINEGKHHCWISPLAVEAIHSFEKEGESAYGYCLLHAHSRAKVSVHDVVPNLLFQLLRQRKAVLGEGERLPNISADIKAYNAIPNDEESGAKKTRALRQAAARIVGLFDAEEKVYLVVDRVDRCRGSDLRDLMAVFVDMMETAICALKVLVVADSLGWSLDVEELCRKCRKASLKQKVEVQGINDEGY